MRREAFRRADVPTVVMVGLLICLAGCGMAPAVAPTGVSVTPSPSVIEAVPIQPVSQTIVVDARVVPVHSVGLTFPFVGLSVAEVFVQENATVVKGTPLARLDTSDLQLKVNAARTAQARANAQYNQLASGATQAELDVARADIAAAQARLRQARGRDNPTDMEAARARLEEAKAHRAELEAGPRQVDLQDATTARDQARAQLDQTRASLAADKEAARRVIEEDANFVRIAQQDLSNAFWTYQRESGASQTGDPICTSRPCIVPPPGNPQLSVLASDVEHSRLALDNALSVLERSKLRYEVAKQTERSDLATAEAGLAAAQVRLDTLIAGPTNAELKNAQATEAEAAARLAQLYDAAYVGIIDAAVAEVSAAQARLDGLLAGPQPSDLAVATVSIEEATVQLRQAERELEKATLVAPMDSVVAEVNIVPGEIPIFGSKPAVVLADTSAWQLEASELTELNIVQIALGAQAMISFDALPDLALTGQVSRISPIGKNSQGETLYTIYVTPDHWDARLRWNMLAQVRISS